MVSRAANTFGPLAHAQSQLLGKLSAIRYPLATNHYPLLLEELCSFFVEGLVVTLDVAQITGGADDVFPRGALGFEQFGDVLVSPLGLGAKVALVDGPSLIIDAGRARDQQNGDAFDVQPQSSRKRRRLGVVVGLV